MEADRNFEELLDKTLGLSSNTGVEIALEKLEAFPDAVIDLGKSHVVELSFKNLGKILEELKIKNIEGKSALDRYLTPNITKLYKGG